MNRPGWRRVSAVLRCRVDFRLAVGRPVRRETPDLQTVSAEELLELFLQPDPAQDGGMAPAQLPRSFSE